MNPIINTSMWVSLPQDVRGKLRSLFNIPRSANVVVTDGRVETDGTTHEDLKALTTEKMQKYLGDTSTDFHKLFDKVVAKVIEELNTPKVTVGKVDIVPPIVSNVTVTPIVPEIKKKRGRPARTNA